MKLNDDDTQVTLTIEDFDNGFSDQTSTVVTTTMRKPYEHEVRITIEMEDEREPCEALMDFTGNTVEILCDICPLSGELSSKTSMIRLVD